MQSEQQCLKYNLIEGKKYEAADCNAMELTKIHKKQFQ
jgi:hypothetical protein